jgi:para-aminobenzoate synthetase
MLECSLDVLVTVIPIDYKWPCQYMHRFLDQFDAIVAGPGPGSPVNPDDVGIMRDIWKVENIPILGICLGFQSLCYHYGATIKMLPEPRHGKVVGFTHSKSDIFEGLPKFSVTLYHSLRAELGHPLEISGDFSNGKECWLPSLQCKDLLPLAWYRGDGSKSEATLMAVRHCCRPLWGFQFHPESCKSDFACYKLVENWWSSVLNFNATTRSSLKRPSSVTNDGIKDSADSDEWTVAGLLRWCGSSTNKTSYRILDRCKLTAEMICEIVDVPNVPSVVLESNSRYSIISVPSPGAWVLEYSVATRRCSLERLSDSKTGEVLELRKGQLWDALRRLLKAKRVTIGKDDVPFWGGFMGFFSYEMGLEKWDFACQDHMENEKTSDASLVWVERSIVVDRKTDKIYIQSIREFDDEVGGWLDITMKRILRFLHITDMKDIIFDLAVTCGLGLSDSNYFLRLQHSNEQLASRMVRESQITLPDERNYKARIKACQEYIRAGESYELCLTDETRILLPNCRNESERAVRPWILYKRLLSYNPAAFSAYAKIGKAKIISSSPECFLQWDRANTFVMKPMKGTVKKTPDMTFEKAQKILNTPKEMGENLMIADLIRHDLFSFCGSGNVTVDKLLEVEDHNRVYQLVTHIKGSIVKLPPVMVKRRSEPPAPSIYHDHLALPMCLPPGSMTGAPKKRSCELLESVELRKRSVYSGVMGYLDLGGGGSFSVLIRTAFSWSNGKSGKETWRIGAGGAVTALSTAEGEWEEMITKLNTVLAIFRPACITPSEPTVGPDLELKEIIEKHGIQRRPEYHDSISLAFPELKAKGVPKRKREVERKTGIDAHGTEEWIEDGQQVVVL